MTIIIGGALGRMGREVALAAREAGIAVACGVDVAYEGQHMDFPMVKAYSQVNQPADVLIDFSRPDSLSELLFLCESRRLPAVLCATGYTVQEAERIEQVAKTVPVLRSANMSLGVAVMEQLAALAARVLGEGFDVEIVEKHHRMKVDSPSGTALMLYEAVRSRREGQAVFGRHGRAAARDQKEIGIHAVRGGSVTGEHEVGFYGQGEQVLLTHRAENRTLFSQGALKAAAFLKGKPAGLYSMRDVVKEILDLDA